MDMIRKGLSISQLMSLTVLFAVKLLRTPLSARAAVRCFVKSASMIGSRNNQEANVPIVVKHKLQR